LEGKITFFFDQEGDVLDVSIGEPQKAISKELENDIAVRVNPESGEIVGFTILNFMKRFKQTKKPQRIDLPIKATITTR